MRVFFISLCLFAYMFACSTSKVSSFAQKNTFVLADFKDGGLEYLLTLDINYFDYPGAGNYSLMHWTAGVGDIETMQYLLSQGLSVNMRDTNGGTPLVFALSENQIEAAHFLINNGADLNGHSGFGIPFSEYYLLCLSKDMPLSENELKLYKRIKAYEELGA